MDLRQLRQFVAVAEECSFRRAALRLHVSQPPLSVAVQKLEADVGVTLLDRTRHHVRLTVAGEAFLREARRTLAHAQQSIDIAQRAAAGKLGTLRLSFVPSAAFNVVPELLRAFRADYPDVNLVLTSDTTSQQKAACSRPQPPIRSPSTPATISQHPSAADASLRRSYLQTMTAPTSLQTPSILTTLPLGRTYNILSSSARQHKALTQW